MVGRIICQVGQAEQRACFGWKNQGQEDVAYDTTAYWEKGGGSIKVPAACTYLYLCTANVYKTMQHSPAHVAVFAVLRSWARNELTCCLAYAGEENSRLLQELATH